MPAKAIAEQAMFNNPPPERQLFADRATFALVIYYDQKSIELPTSGPLCNLFRALHDLEFEKPLNRRPVFLIGGFDAWLEYAGMNWVQGRGVDGIRSQSSPISSDTSNVPPVTQNGVQGPMPVNPQIHQSQNHAILTKLSKGGGINRHDGRLIVQNIGEYVCYKGCHCSMRSLSLLQAHTLMIRYPMFFCIVD